ncbi:PREDICTED: transcription factor GTE4-like isoform X3 [Tarenaya hassleriana]|uniref:transcription factor GTE4-like isoform X3 n=1 Tax=Tarenaya hassleriana TaxID=28532 RepID=UPI00053C8FDF|nr:PREDICTED: transcription factor GTE4-like isoform X3 [Tarenaya hassleriana]
MASRPVNGEGNDVAKETQSFKVYTRKDRRQRKRTPSVVVADDRDKPEAKVEDGDDSNRLNPPVTLADNSVDSIVVGKNSVEAVSPGTVSQEDAKASIEEPSENPCINDSDKVVEAPPQADVQDVPTLASVDKTGTHPCPWPLPEDDAKAVVVEKSVEVPFESQAQKDANTVVIDKSSIETSLKTLALEDVGIVVVDKNTIEASPQTLSHGGAHAVVDKNPIEVPSEEHVNVADVDNSAVEVPLESLAQLDTSDALQHALVPFESVPVREPLQVMAPSTRSVVTGSAPMEEASDDRVKIHLASSSREQKEEIRKKLEDQLNLVRGLVRRIEAKESEIGAYNYSRVLANSGLNNGGGRILTGFVSAGTPREVVRASRPLHQLSISVLENSQGMIERVEKEKRTPKANQFYKNSEFLLANEKFPPTESNKKSKSSANKLGGEVGHGFKPGSKVFKACSALLERLMKHKYGWVFNAPVDVKGLGLHDYFTIIKYPMDLGTVKSRLTKNWYKSPGEFAEDVRLTFQNAMTYNPKGQDVHAMAEQLSMIFEDKWAVIEAEYYKVNLATPTSRLAPAMPPPPINVKNLMDRSDWSSRPVEMQPKPASTTPSGRTPALKKPKANEPNKRDMTFEEKQKLSANLQNLPTDKLDAIVQIVKKRNTAVKLRDEEIEVDIDSVDPETLWELDRFVTNYKKSLSKKKRKAELAVQARAEAERNAQQMNAAPVAVGLAREGGTAAQKSIPTPLLSRAEKPSNEESRSSSSSSSTSDSSSSSSDSDSDSSSSSGSDQT